MLMRRLSVTVLLAPLALALASCTVAEIGDATVNRRSTSTEVSNKPATITAINEGYSLLHVLFEKQSEVDKALWLRKTPPEFAAVIRQIAKASREYDAQLKAFAASDAGLSLTLTPLPRAELETRASIEKAETAALLKTTGHIFRRRLLLSQVSSMQYASHLARTLSTHETVVGRKSALIAIADRCGALEQQVIEQLNVDELPATGK